MSQQPRESLSAADLAKGPDSTGYAICFATAEEAQRAATILASAEKGERVGAAKRDDIFWPPNEGAEELLYEIRNGSTEEYVRMKANELKELWSGAAPAGEQIEGLRKEERQQWAEKVAIGVRMRKLIEMLDGEVETIKSKGYRDNLPDLVEWAAKIQAALLSAGGKE